MAHTTEIEERIRRELLARRYSPRTERAYIGSVRRLAMLRELSGRKRLVAALPYGSGLRVNEALHLRGKDVRIEVNEIVVRHGKGRKDRVTMIPDRLRDPLARRIIRRRRLHEEGLARDAGRIPLRSAPTRASSA